MRALVLAAALLCCAAATAHADTALPGTFHGPFVLDAGPVLMGDQVVWAATAPLRWSAGEGGYSASTSLYSAPVAGGAARRLARVGSVHTFGDNASGEDVLTLAGSPTRLAWMTATFDIGDGRQPPPTQHAYSMSVLGTGTVCRGNERLGPAVPPAGLALSGDTLVLSGCGGVTVRDLAHPETPPRALAPDGGPVSAAGSYVAWRTGDGFELLDAATGTRTTFSTAGLPAEIAGFDVSPEGVLAVTTGSLPPIRAEHVSWASPAQPSWHPHTLQAPAVGAPRVRANRIALVTHAESGLRQLRLIDLAGTETVIAEGDGAANGDFDGTTITWGATACDALTVGVRPVTAGKLTLSDADHCPVVIDPAGVRANRRGRVAIRLRCPAPALPRASDRCAGTLTLTRGGRVVGRARFKVAGGAWGRARVKLLANGRRVRVTVEARSVTRGHASRSTQRVMIRS